MVNYLLLHIDLNFKYFFKKVFGEKHICGIIILEQMLKEKNMKYILITIVAILFASCSSPMMPVATVVDVVLSTDSELVYASEKTLSYTVIYSDGKEVVGTKTFTSDAPGTVPCIVEIDGVESNTINLNFRDGRLAGTYTRITKTGPGAGTYTIILYNNGNYDAINKSNSVNVGTWTDFNGIITFSPAINWIGVANGSTYEDTFNTFTFVAE